MSFIIQNCIDWNEREMRRAKADSEDRNIRVPATAKKRVREDGRPRLIQMTADEYRADRLRDARRHSDNVEFLKTQLRTVAA